MKKIFYLLLLTAITLQGQTTGVNKLRIASNPEKPSAGRVMVQDAATGEVGYINKTTLATSVEVNAKEPTIATGTTSQYYRGDKTWQTLDNTVVGLGNVDNTSDANKPISTATQTALDGKQATLVSGTNIKTVESQSLLGSGNVDLTKTDVGLSNVDNTSDVNKPVSSATQTALNAKQNTSEKNQVNGYAGLGSDGKLISAQLPSITITDTFVVGSQSAMLALTAETGDVAVRTDLSKSYILKGTNPALLGDWQELLSPVDGVTSVFGRVGSVTAQTGDYTTAQVTETTNKKYQTDAQALYNDATSSIQTQLNLKATDSNTVHKTGDETIAGIKTFTSLANFSGSGIRVNTNGWLTPNQVYGETGNFFVNYSGTGNTIIGNPTGNVGIGTTSPGQKLVVDGGSTDFTPIFAKSSLLSGGKYFSSLLAGYQTDVSKSAQFGYAYNTSNIADSFAHITTFGSAEGSQFAMKPNGNVSIGDTPGNYKFYVNGGQYGTILKGGDLGTGSEVLKAIKADNSIAMLVRGDGKVSIGDSGAEMTARLNVAGNLGSSVGNNNSAIKLINTDTGNYASIGAGIVGTTNEGMQLSTDGVSRMVISSTGLIGIGTTYPVQKLHIEGGSYIGSDSFMAQNMGLFFNGNGNYGSGVYSRNLGQDLVLQAGGGEAVRVQNNGNVGIGTQTPSAGLQINRSSWSLNGSTVSKMIQKYVGSAGDYEQHVILLHPVYNGTLINYNKCSGTIYATRGGLSMGLINDTYNFDTASAYNSQAGTINSQWGYGRLYTCLYNGVKYMALLPDYRTSAVEYNFDGYSKSTGEQLKVVAYRNSSNGTILNSEINNSLTLYTPGTSYFQGDIYSASSITATAFYQSSDLRLKDIIKRDGDVIYYKWKDKRDDKIHIGYVAQEVQKENPEQVNTDEKGMLSVNYIEILVEKIKKLEKEIELLKAK